MSSSLSYLLLKFHILCFTLIIILTNIITNLLFREDIDSFFEGLDRPITSVEEKRRTLADDIGLITSHCPQVQCSNDHVMTLY